LSEGKLEIHSSAEVKRKMVGWVSDIPN
jgi:hypothetical protein